MITPVDTTGFSCPLSSKVVGLLRICNLSMTEIQNLLSSHIFYGLLYFIDARVNLRLQKMYTV